jgi:hypothetical protein
MLSRNIFRTLRIIFTGTECRRSGRRSQAEKSGRMSSALLLIVFSGLDSTVLTTWSMLCRRMKTCRIRRAIQAGRSMRLPSLE